jgi:hypothetical protein
MGNTITIKELKKIIGEELASIKKEDLIPGGLGDNMSIADVAKKHNVQPQHIADQLKKGIHVEHEHTNDVRKAAEIAMDHLVEDPDYYTKLKTIDPND